MAVELKVPALLMDMEEVAISRWLVKEGATVKKGDPLLEIDTDKSTFEVESPADGEVHGIRGEPGDTMPVGARLAYILAPGEKEAGLAERLATTSDGEIKRNEKVRSARSQRGQKNGRELRASPAARRAAAERGIALEDVRGSGPYGRVYLSDVLAVDTSEMSRELPIGMLESTCEDEEGGVIREPLSRIRRIGAERTARSFAEVPHFYLTRELEVGRLLELHEKLKEKLVPAPSFNDLLSFAVCRTLPDHPRINSRYEDGMLLINRQVNLGIAVATDDGLVVPVVRGANDMRLAEFVACAREVISHAREGRLSPQELSGATFTVSNLGMMGIDSFDAVINPPEAAILAVGRVKTVPEWHEGEWLPRRVISVTLSVDHRAADGADGSRFLAALADVLLDWELLL
ncbi:MAG: 2-oxo acid dehydrogenase subunit E2 [Rubrobacteraceae bacterium]|nr:2-oxo acid dehydrogenase subunit E2 [Rubrobacteraceae bacterium]MCL6438369.1 2-oxo acid dehydrogenase subunit E2 [Rubrobacteraceae bacterium]